MGVGQSESDAGIREGHWGQRPAGRMAAIGIVLLLMVFPAACTSEPDSSDPDASAVEAEVLRADGSPVPVLLETDFRQSIANANVESCQEIDEAASAGLDNTDFAHKLDDFAGSHPSAHAQLLSELVVIGEVLDQCLDGERPSETSLEALDAQLARWQERLA